MNTLSERLNKLMSIRGINASELAEITTISEGALSRILKSETRSPKTSFIARIVDHFKLNPYDLYNLLMGEVYTEKPQGSVTAELEIYKEKCEEMKKREEWYQDVIKKFQEHCFIPTASGTEKNGVGLGEITPTAIIPHRCNTLQEEDCGVSVSAEKEKPDSKAPY